MNRAPIVAETIEFYQVHRAASPSAITHSGLLA
jgi:hypothetical protein